MVSSIPYIYIPYFGSLNTIKYGIIIVYPYVYIKFYNIYCIDMANILKNHL